MNKEKKNLTFDRLRDKAEVYCMRAEHCSMQVSDLLKRHGATQEQISQIIEGLKKEGFIDESRFSEAFARDKHRFNGWGKERIRLELKARHIAETDIVRALELLTEQFDMQSAVEELLMKKYRSLKDFSFGSAYPKLMRYGLYRGYSYELVDKVARELLKDNGE
ncbi:regulatory protein RecX [Porphyromonas macacae]|uniref:regulatory protein RecX n=1 Tax=Porphyromonas macacae TaxID=28115 RepID=UPI0024AD32F4|nr:regulatory protein RecX [Porphyromonas macacae]